MKDEVICPRCRQINVRSSGSWLERMLTNPKYSEICTLCQTNLKTGQRSTVDSPRAWIMWFGIYLSYVIGLMGLFSLPFWLLILFTAQLEKWFSLFAISTLIGFVVGLWIAEKKRRRGELLYSPKRRW
jgi:uncharacterized protein (DUF983 family)